MLRDRLLIAALAVCAGLAAMGAPTDGRAGVLGKNRFHVVKRPAGKRSFRSRLRAPTRRNLRGIGLYHRAGTRPGEGGWGTAFLVARQRDGTALVLTNAHVTDGLGVGTVSFGHEAAGGGVAASGVRLVASSTALDYALVRVALPPGARLPVLALSGREALPERVYSSGFDDLSAVNDDADLGNFDWSERDRRELPALAGKGPVQSIQTGRVLLGGAARLIGGMRDPGGEAIAGEVARVTLDLGGIGGGSGRPIFSAADHRVVAIHSSSGIVSRPSADLDLATAEGADAAGASMVVPAHVILGDIARQLAERAIAGEDAALVEELLQRSGPLRSVSRTGSRSSNLRSAQ
jgi:hypothetical protein